jgi:hypothetical protein
MLEDASYPERGRHRQINHMRQDREETAGSETRF